jgi:hypothetical protein
MRWLAVAALVLAGCGSGVEPAPIASVSHAPSTRRSEVPAAPSVDDDVPLMPSQLAALHDYVAETRASATVDPARSPEVFAKSMVGVVPCNKQSCRAGKEICVAAPSPDFTSHCEPIVAWLHHATPKPKSGFPAMAGVMACDGSENCPPDTVCCLHEIGDADVQAVVCHASASECRDGLESCSAKGAPGCRTPGTHCDGLHCVR